MKRTYQFCLLLYPRDYRDQFAEEMILVFEEASAEASSHGWAWQMRFLFGEFAGLVGASVRARIEPRSVVPAPAQNSTARWVPKDLADAQRRVDETIAGMVHAIANHQFERARFFSNQERVARENLRILRERYSDDYGISI